MDRLVTLPLGPGGSKRRKIVQPVRDPAAPPDAAGERMLRAYIAGDLWRIVARYLDQPNDLARLAATCVQVRHALLTGPNAPADVAYAIDWLGKHALTWLSTSRLVFMQSAVPPCVWARHSYLPTLQKDDGSACGRHAVVAWRLHWLREIVRQRSAMLFRWLVLRWRAVGRQELVHQVIVDMAATGWIEGIEVLRGLCPRRPNQNDFERVKAMHAHPLFSPPNGNYPRDSISQAVDCAMPSAAYFGHSAALDLLLHMGPPSLELKRYTRLKNCIEYAMVGPGSASERSAMVDWILDRLAAMETSLVSAGIHMEPFRLPYNGLQLFGHGGQAWQFAHSPCSLLLAVAAGRDCLDAGVRVVLRHLDGETGAERWREIALDAVRLYMHLQCHLDGRRQRRRDRVGLSNLAEEHLRTAPRPLLHADGLERLVDMAFQYGAASESVAFVLVQKMLEAPFAVPYLAPVCRLLQRRLNVRHDWGLVFARCVPTRCTSPCQCVEWARGCPVFEQAIEDWAGESQREEAVARINAAARAIQEHLRQWNAVHRRKEQVHPQRIVVGFLDRAIAGLDAASSAAPQPAVPPAIN